MASQETSQVAQLMANVPRDADGNPMQLVGFAMAEKIGLPNYSNVDVGPAVCFRYIPVQPDTDEGREETLRQFNKVCTVVEEIMGEHRELVLKAIKGQ